MPYTIEHVEEAWNNFLKYTETAEQHEFPQLIMIHVKGEPLFKDLHDNWDENHAELFMRFMRMMGERFGFKVPEPPQKEE
jgi:mannosyltransferase OCH1-like enzyme